VEIQLLVRIANEEGPHNINARKKGIPIEPRKKQVQEMKTFWPPGHKTLERPLIFTKQRDSERGNRKRGAGGGIREKD